MRGPRPLSASESSLWAKSPIVPKGHMLVPTGHKRCQWRPFSSSAAQGRETSTIALVQRLSALLESNATTAEVPLRIRSSAASSFKKKRGIFRETVHEKRLELANSISQNGFVTSLALGATLVLRRQGLYRGNYFGISFVLLLCGCSRLP